jgi:hypothetical protein
LRNLKTNPRRRRKPKTMPINVTNIEVLLIIAGVLLSGTGITLKIFWESIKSSKQDMIKALKTMQDDLQEQERRVSSMEGFMKDGLEEIKELQNKNLQANMEASGKLTIAITKINTTLDYVIKRQDKHEDEIDKIKDKK